MHESSGTSLNQVLGCACGYFSSGTARVVFQLQIIDSIMLHEFEVVWTSVVLNCFKKIALTSLAREDQ